MRPKYMGALPQINSYVAIGTDSTKNLKSPKCHQVFLLSSCKLHSENHTRSFSLLAQLKGESKSTGAGAMDGESNFNPFLATIVHGFAAIPTRRSAGSVPPLNGAPPLPLPPSDCH